LDCSRVARTNGGTRILEPRPERTNCPARSLGGKDGQNSNACVYIVGGSESTRRTRREPMAFKPNYRRDRAERQRAARAHTEEKQRKKEEKAALRKAEREAAEAPPDEKQTTGQP